MAKTDTAHTVVLGLGNLLMADDSVGLAALSRLQDEWFIPDDVELVDGGTWGMNLIPVVDRADRLLVLDAIDVGEEPGTLVQLEGDEVPRRLVHKLSPHQIELREVLALAELRGTLPGQLIALGIQPACVRMATELSPQVEARVADLVRLAAAALERWGVRCFPVTRGGEGVGAAAAAHA